MDDLEEEETGRQVRTSFLSFLSISHDFSLEHLLPHVSITVYHLPSLLLWFKKWNERIRKVLKVVGERICCNGSRVHKFTVMFVMGPSLSWNCCNFISIATFDDFFSITVSVVESLFVLLSFTSLFYGFFYLRKNSRKTRKTSALRLDHHPSFDQMHHHSLIRCFTSFAYRLHCQEKEWREERTNERKN